MLMLGFSVFSRVRRRTVRAQGASSGSTILVFVVQLTRGGAAGTHARSSAALPRAICGQAYSLKSRVPVESRAGGGEPKNGVRSSFSIAHPRC
jgi:hypothetical protein